MTLATIAIGIRPVIEYSLGLKGLINDAKLALLS